MSFISVKYLCLACGTKIQKLRKRSDNLSTYTCTCGEEMYRTFDVNITSVSYVDGSNNRFAGAKERRELEKEKRKAKKSGDNSLVAAITREQKRVKEATKNEREKINICKKEVKD